MERARSPYPFAARSPSISPQFCLIPVHPLPMMRGTCSRKGSCFTQYRGSLPSEQREHGAMETFKICPTTFSIHGLGIRSIGQVISRIRTSANRRKVKEITKGDDGGSQGQVARSASVYTMATTTAGATSVTAATCSTGSSILRTQHMVD